MKYNRLSCVRRLYTTKPLSGFCCMSLLLQIQLKLFYIKKMLKFFCVRKITNYFWRMI